MHPPESQVPMCCLHDHTKAPQLPLPSTSSHTPLQPPGGNADPTAGPAERAELHGAALPLPGAPALSVASCGTAATGVRVTFAGPGVVFKHIAPHPPPGRKQSLCPHSTGKPSTWRKCPGPEGFASPLQIMRQSVLSLCCVLIPF